MGTTASGHQIHNLPENHVIIDVRTAKEFCEGHLCGAINIHTLPPPNTNKENLEHALRSATLKISRDTTILVYCKKGIRSTKAEKILKKLGYKVINLGGVEDEPLKNIIYGNVKTHQLEKCQC